MVTLLALLWLHKWATAALAFFAYYLFHGQTPIGQPMRRRPGAGVPPGESWYIESQSNGGAPPHSCSFVEFDGHGDYIDFEQHTHAWQSVDRLARQQPLLLILYCHGWKNNSQSADVVSFLDFLGRIAASSAVFDPAHGLHYRVHGIYLGWRGNPRWPLVAHDAIYQKVAARFGGPVVADRFSRRRWWTEWLPENLSYWSRRRAAEHKVSSLAMARTVYTCASVLKARDIRHQRSITQLNSGRVIVMGHSFGALMLERALNATLLDPLIDQWTWFQKPAEPADATSAPRTLPLDFVLFVNSAAPSVYAKAMRDFLAAHQSALRRAKVPGAYAPDFVSLTSSADSATGRLHPLANLFSWFHPSLRRKYSTLLKLPASRPLQVNQSWFYRRTPGHQPLLVDHWLVPAPPPPPDPDPAFALAPASPAEVLEQNLHYGALDPLGFWTSTPPQYWRLTLHPPAEEQAFAGRFGPLNPSRGSYWFIRCDRRIIKDHNDVWSTTAMEVYAGLYRLVEWSRYPENSESNEVLGRYWNTKPIVE